MDEAKGHGAKIGRKREIFIACLLTESNIRNAAKKAGIGENTGWRWLQEPDFQRDYRAARRLVVSQAISQLQQACAEAVVALRQIINDESAPPSARVTAARTVLDTAVRGVELEDLTGRIEALEEVSTLTGGGHLLCR